MMLTRGSLLSLVRGPRSGLRTIFWWGHDTLEDQQDRAREAKMKEKGLISWTDPKKDLAAKEEFVWAPARIEQEAAMVLGMTTGLTNHADLQKWIDRKVMRPVWHTWATDPVHFREEMRKKSYRSLVLSQIFLRERLEALGPDLAAAHFLCHRNCKVRFRGHDHWTELQPNGTLNIPALYVAGWYIEAIEASTANLVYEGLQNFRNLEHLKVVYCTTLSTATVATVTVITFTTFEGTGTALATSNTAVDKGLSDVTEDISYRLTD